MLNWLNLRRFRLLLSDSWRLLGYTTASLAFILHDNLIDDLVHELGRFHHLFASDLSLVHCSERSDTNRRLLEHFMSLRCHLRPQPQFGLSKLAIRQP